MTAAAMATIATFEAATITRAILDPLAGVQGKHLPSGNRAPGFAAQPNPYSGVRTGLRGMKRAGER
jgi:hypothetical protein